MADSTRRSTAASSPSATWCSSSRTPARPPTEQTDVWVFFDDDQIYVSARNWDSAPPEEWVADEMRRDTGNLRQNETFGVSFDTFYDRRSGFQFYTNPLGALAEFSIVDEGAPNADWNPVWDVRTGRFDGGLDGRDGDPLQVAPLSLRCVEGMGFPGPPVRSATRTSGSTSLPCPKGYAAVGGSLGPPSRARW